MPTPNTPHRRAVLRALTSFGLVGATPLWAQPSKNNRAITVAQIADTSNSQIDVSKDFLVGSRAAWQDINRRGGLQGNAVEHLVIEVDGSAASLHAAVDSLKGVAQCVAVFGSSGDRAATQLASLLAQRHQTSHTLPHGCKMSRLSVRPTLSPSSHRAKSKLPTPSSRFP